ncbi:hypothetical protein FOL47_001775 [Perkinsus chesapeaki]|uniref:Uncharacterized protein n=1 Tax=Perkinsus chesapeaki TaxID=330153 RepID=A0A7J6MHK7_PERCH|nr:hypothetical protein FOL47_001775 [Perkinsus chesapeaki]
MLLRYFTRTLLVMHSTSASTEDTLATIRRAISDSKDHQIALLNGEEPDYSKWSEQYISIVKLLHDTNNSDGHWTGMNALALKMDKDFNDSTDACEFLQTRSTKHKRLVSPPNFSPQGYLVRLSATTRRLSIFDFESGYGEIYTTLLAGRSGAAVELSTGALTYAGGLVAAAIGNKISIIEIEIKSPAMTVEDRIHRRGVKSAFLNRPPNVTVWSHRVVDVGKQDVIGLLVQPSGRASAGESNNVRIVTVTRGGGVWILSSDGDILNKLSGANVSSDDVIGVVPINRQGASHSVLVYGKSWIRTLAIRDDSDAKTVEGVERLLGGRYIATISSGHPVGPLPIFYATLEDGSLLVMALVKNRRHSDGENYNSSDTVKGLFALPSCEAGSPSVLSLRPQILAVSCGQFMSIYDITVGRKLSLKAARRGQSEESAVFDPPQLFDETHRLPSGLPWVAGIAAWRKEVTHPLVAVWSSTRVRVFEVVLPLEYDTRLESEQAMWNYFRMIVGLVFATGTLLYVYCVDYASEKRTNLRLFFQDVGVPRGCADCRKGFIDVLKMYNRTARKSINDRIAVWYTVNTTADGLKLIIQPGKYMKRAKALLKRFNLPTTIWDNGLPYAPLGPYSEDSLEMPVDEDVSATLTYSNCAQGLTRMKSFYCRLPTSPLLKGIRLQFVPDVCSPFLGRLDFIQETSGSPVLETVGSVGYLFSNSRASSTISLIKTPGTDLSSFLALKSLGNDSDVRTYEYWLGSDRIEYDFLYEKVLIDMGGVAEFEQC